MAITELMALSRYQPAAPVQSARQHRWFLLLLALSLVVFWAPLTSLARLASNDDRYSYVALIPLISAVLVYLSRQKIFLVSRPCPTVGIPLLVVGITLYGIVRAGSSSLGQSASLSLEVPAIVGVWIAGFVCCYGPQASRAAVFPLVFLALAIPLPPSLLERAVVTLQRASAEMAYGLFKLTGIPVLRQGFTFSLPGLDIEIAEQCSGIRSSLSLLITSILAGHLVLRSTWRRLWLCLLTVPIVIFKNAIRIVTISWLGVYVNRGVLAGSLHRSSGLVFSPLALIILACLLYALHKSEDKASNTRLALFTLLSCSL
jgi:exosortase